MKAKKIAVWVCGIWFLTTSCVWAVEFGFQPRLQGGVMYYEYEQDNVPINTSVGGGLLDNLAQSLGFGGVNELLEVVPGSVVIPDVSTSKFKVAGPMATLGGGFTAYVGRFFVDISAQKALENDDDDSLITKNSGTAAVPGVGVGFGTEQQSNSDTDFDREDYAVSIGLNLTENFVLFTGYKYAETEFDSDVNGTVTLTAVSNMPAILPPSTVSDDFTGNTKLTFRQNGPFVGLGYSVPIDRGFFDGQLSAKLAVAFLDGKVNSSNKNFMLASGTVVDDTSASIKGESIGLSIGLNWNGRTGISGLNYMLGINGYQYDFDADDRGDPDFQEFSIGFNAGVGYGF